MGISDIPGEVRERVRGGLVIPAHPLALDAHRHLDKRRQRALTRYYLEAGAGGVAVGVHTTQFAIRHSGVDLLRPVLELASATIDTWVSRYQRPVFKVAGVCGRTPQARREAELAVELGYHAGLLSLGALRDDSVEDLIAHCRVVVKVIPILGFYLQPAVGGRVLPYAFWREFVEIENILAIKIAPFNRYQTWDVVRAVADAGRERDIALYTGNDDNIVLDLLTPFPASGRSLQIVGGLLGQWAVWTQRAVELLERIRARIQGKQEVPPQWLAEAAAITDTNAAIFDAANGFRGCIPGIHEVLRRQGLLKGIWCLDPDEGLSPGQADEIDRVYRSYPFLNDDAFVKPNLERWLADT